MKASEVRFGIEVECFVPTTVDIQVGGYHRGLQIAEVPQGWNGQSDGSIHAPAGYRPVEVVSPVLAGEAGLVQVFYVLDWLRERGAQVNRSCGLHVHVDATDLSRSDIRRIMQVFLRHEKALFSINGSQAEARWDNQFCKRSARWLDPLADRYQSLNLSNVGRQSKNTVEFRLYAGTLDPEEVVTAVYASVALVVAAVNGEIVGTDPVDNPTKAFIREILTADNAAIVPEVPVGDVARIMVYKAREVGALI